jgi:rod shape-determining protein MreC
VALYRRARSTRLLVFSLVMLSLVTITVDYKGGREGPFEVAGRGALAIVGSMQQAVSRVLHPIGAFFSGLAHVGSLESENRRLRARIRELERQTHTSISTERELEQALALLNLQKQHQLTGVAARVIGLSVSNFEWTITIDHGSSSGIEPNMPVISGDGLVGHVIQIAPGQSTVMLILDPDSAVAARLSSSGETGLVVGRRDQDLRMELVNPEANVIPNEQVVTSGYQGGLYPPEIPVGIVSHIFRNTGSLSATISVHPSVDFSALEFVSVVTGSRA